MKSQKVFLLVAISIAINVWSYAQTQTPRHISTTANSGGFYEYLPAGYNTDSKKYPLIIFLHGLGELGDGGPDQLPKLLWQGIPKLINWGQFPSSFTVGSQTFSFIVISPQFKGWPSPADVNDIVDYAVQNYKVNTNRIYVTGLSMGGGITWDYTAYYPNRVTAIVPACGASWPDASKAQAIANAHIPVWATHNEGDGTVPSWYTKDWVTNINNNGGTAKNSIWTSTDHDCWTLTYNPTYRENGMNVYEWMLQYQKTESTSNQAPIASTGANQTITLPLNSVTLTGNGTDADGSIASYSWSKQSGPSGGIINSPANSSTTVIGLTQGTYIFRLTVTDDKGATGTNDVTVTVNAAANQPPVANAGADQVLTLPTNNSTLKGAGTDADGTIVSYTWVKLSGPAEGTVVSPGLAQTNVSNLTQGTYVFRLSVTDNNGAIGTDDVTIVVNAASTTASSLTANDFSSFVSYTGKYGFGLNPGWYGFNWTTQQIVDLGTGNVAKNVKGIGAKTFRMQLYDDFLTQYGTDFLVADFEHIKQQGGGEITAFVGGPHGSHKWDTAFYDDGNPWKDNYAKVFKGMYEPIWLDANKTQINPNNTYAKYLYDVVNTYGQYVTFWEIVNEPDFTYGDGGWSGDAENPGPNSWFFRDPTPQDLVNLRVPVYYYIRMLRISWEVIKKLQPNDYICTGGIGSRSFLAALLRNTDNPDGGKVTANYPLKTGAYFDVLSFHTYPEFMLRHWNYDPAVTPAPDGFVYYRHSDGAIKSHLKIKNWMDSLLRMDGYNGTLYPYKQFICTETGMSRHTDADEFGGNEVQKNYMIKAHVLTQKDGQVKQTYWFTTGDQQSWETFHWDAFGCYKYFGDKYPYDATPADQGIAMKTTSDLLYGKTYDAKKTAELNLPPTIEGGAFKASDGSFIYVLWAKTSTDLSETAFANYSFPAGIITSGYVKRKEWNYSETDSSILLTSTGIHLSGSPAFFEWSAAPPSNQAPKANAGADQTITLPVNTVTLSGSGFDADGSVTSYSWKQIEGPSSASIVSSAKELTIVNNLVQGVYKFELTITDNVGATGKDTVAVTVNAATNQLPSANAGVDQSITLPLNTVSVNGAGTDPDGSIVGYQWTKQEGPDSYTISTATTAATSITGLVAGVYLFRLTVTDNKGATATDDVQITVNVVLPAANIPPMANAGKDISITLPANRVQLIGTGTDPDGTIVAYQWAAIDGPATYQISTPLATKTSITDLVEGTYRFKFTVTDNAGASAWDTVRVIVKPAKLRSSVSLYPNPTSTIINVKIEAATSKNNSLLRIYNSMGTIVYQEEFIRNEAEEVKQIDVSMLEKGVYIVTVNADINTMISLKFIKE